jgi:acetoin utilization deacetylase AcuC-like enzyme
MRPLLFYSARYFADVGTHVFPMEKYRLIRDSLIAGGVAVESDFVEPEPATIEDALLVHDREYVDKLLNGTLSIQEILTLELPYSQELVEASFLGAGGTISAVRSSLERGVGVNVAGGFHHAFADHGEGFCVLNDVAMGVARALADGLVERAAVVDCDVHQGNGTADIFGDDDRVYTLSIHQEQNYPLWKPPSNLDIGLPDGTDGASYVRLLESGVGRIFEEHGPEHVMYVAGADPYRGDLLGGLGLTRSDLSDRDELVLGTCAERNVPVTVVLAGGYARDTSDTVAIQATTIARAIAIGEDWRSRA